MVKIHNATVCIYERTQQVRLGSPGRKNGAASSRRVQNSVGIPRVSSPMGNNEDSASFITTCSSIPDLTTRVALPRGWAGGSTLGLTSGSPHAHKRDESNAPGAASVSLSNRFTSQHVYITHTPPPSRQPLIFSRFPDAYPGNARGSARL